MKAWKAELLLFFVTFIWGGTFVFTKFGLHDAPPSLYVFIRFTTAFLITVIFFWKHIIKIHKSTLLRGLLLGTFFGAGFILQTTGLGLTTVTKSAFITGMAVVFTPFVFKLVQKKRILFWPKIGVIIAFIGLYLFANPKFNNINLGDFLTLLSTFFWALYIVYMDVFTKGKNDFSETVQLVSMQLLGTMIISFMGHIFLEKASFNVNFSSTLLITLAYNGILASFILTFIHTSFQRYTTPVKAALIFSLEPVIASIVAVIVINEILSGREYIGAAILFIGVMTSELGDIVFRYFKRTK